MLRSPVLLSHHLASSVLILAILVIASTVLGQRPDTLWTRFYGGPDYDDARSIQQTSDGGYMLAGGTKSFGAGATDVYLIKADADGDTLWTRVYGGPGSDRTLAAQQTSDGGYILVGYSWSFGAGLNDVYVVKTDSSGDTLWTMTFGGTEKDVGWSVRETSDSMYIIAGETASFGQPYEVLLLKITADGDIVYARTYGGAGDDRGFAVVESFDGGYVIAGFTNSFGAGNYDIYLIKTDVDGDTLWTRTYGGARIEGAYSMERTADGGYIITGYTDSHIPLNTDVYLIRTDANGDTIWTRTYGGPRTDAGFSVKHTSDGGFIIAGLVYPSLGRGYMYLVRTDSVGDTLWTGWYGDGTGSEALSVDQTDDGGYIVAGYMDEDIYVIRLDSEQAAIDGDVTALQLMAPKIGPNPSRGSLTIAFRLQSRQRVQAAIYDVRGRFVVSILESMFDRGDHSVGWVYDRTHDDALPPGIYLCRLQAGEQAITKKIVILQ